MGRVLNDRDRELQKQWRKRNPERVSFLRKRYWSRNPNAQVEFKRKWRSANPEKARLLTRQSLRRRRYGKELAEHLEPFLEMMYQLHKDLKEGNEDGETTNESR